MERTNGKIISYILGASIGVILFFLVYLEKQYAIVFYSIFTIGFLFISGVKVEKGKLSKITTIFLSSNMVAWFIVILYWCLYTL